jgi:hypothetical protein
MSTSPGSCGLLVPDSADAAPAHESSAAGPDAGGSPPEQVIVNFSDRSVHALDCLARITDDTRTDSINKAVQVYAYLRQALTDGHRLYLNDPASHRTDRLQIA